MRVAAVGLRVEEDFAASDEFGARVVAVVIYDAVAFVANCVVAVSFFEQGGLSLVDAVSGCELDEGGDDCDEVHACCCFFDCWIQLLMIY